MQEIANILNTTCELNIRFDTFSSLIDTKHLGNTGLTSLVIPLLALLIITTESLAIYTNCDY